MKTMLLLAAAGLWTTAAAAEPFSLDYDASDTIVGEIEDLGDATGAVDEKHKGRKHKGDKAKAWKKAKEVCAKLNLTDEQKAELKTAVYDFKRDVIPMVADLKVAKLEYMRSLAADSGTRGDADAAGVKIKTNVDSLMDAKLGFVNGVFFDILTAEQRPAGVKCAKAIKAVRKSGHHRH